MLEAVAKLGVTADIQRITDIADIMSYGVLSTPGLVVDDELKISGRVPNVSEVMNMLKG